MWQSAPSNPTPKSRIEQDNSHVQAGQRQKEPTKEPTISDSNSRSITQPIEQPATNDAAEPKESRLYRAYLWATIIGVVGGLIGLVLLRAQFKATRDAAEAAQKSAETAERALRIAERADVLLDSASIVFDPITQRLDGLSQVSMRIQNCGRTRAKNIRIKVEFTCPDFDALDKKSESDLPAINLGAGAGQTIGFDRFQDFMSKEIFSRIASGQIPFGFRLRIRYEDVFGEEHSSDYAGTLSRPNGFNIANEAVD